MTATPFTDAQATDEAVLMLVRKLRRLHPEACADLMAKLPEGAREALHGAEMRADTLRAYDKRDGVARRYVLREERIAAELDGLDDAAEAAAEDADEDVAA